MEFRGSLPLPPSDEGYEVLVAVDEECQITTTAPKKIKASDAILMKEKGDKQKDERRGLVDRIGVASSSVNDYHMDAHLWDCCNIILTRLVTDLNWSTDGITITGWNAGGYESHHGEFSCGGGWYTTSSYLQQWSGGTGNVQIGVRSHAEWGYQGAFDCSGTRFYNVFDNYVWGDIRGIGSCDYYYSLRSVAYGFHLQIQCYNPLVTKFDYTWY